VKEGFTAATDRTSGLSFGAPVYVYVAAAQPELGMLILGDVDAALAALHRGDLGAFRSHHRFVAALSTRSKQLRSGLSPSRSEAGR
jgi:hypothetical protein